MKKLLIQKNDNKIFFVKSIDNDVIGTMAIDTENTSIVGNIYVGKVNKVVKDSFAFVDIKQSKNAFININDKKEEAIKNIKSGDDILVQVVRDQSEIKGANLTSEIVLKGKYIMLVHAFEKQVGISKKIDNTNIKKRLRKLGSTFEYSCVFRTEAEFAEKEDIQAEYEVLKEKMDYMILQGRHEIAPKLVFEQNENFDVVGQIKQLSSDCDIICVNNQEFYEELTVQDFNHKLICEKTTDLFDFHNVRKQIDELFYQKVWLKSGGFLIIEYTEAFVIVDVNSGKNIKERDKERLAFNTNREAVEKLLDQVVLRNLSGIILVDLIDMKDENNKDEIVRFAKDLVSHDTDFTIHGLTNLGILEITRRKRSEPIYKILLS